MVGKRKLGGFSYYLVTVRTAVGSMGDRWLE